MLCPPQPASELQISHTQNPACVSTCPDLPSHETTQRAISHLLCHGPGPCRGPGLGPGRSLAQLLPHSSRWRFHHGPASCARACCPGASLQQMGKERQEECYGMKGPPWGKLAAPRALWNAGSMPTIPSRAWAPGLALPHSQGRERGFPARAPPFSSLRLLEGCLCCSFCRLFREAVLSLGTSDFTSICKGTHLCLLPAKGHGLVVTQVQRAFTSSPAAPSCHTAQHMEERKDWPCPQTSLQASLDAERHGGT